MIFPTGYSFASSFNKYKNEINNFAQDSKGIYEGYCTNITEEDGNKNNSCPKAMKYLNYLKSHGYDDYSANGCKYLSYWIQHEIFKKPQTSNKTLLYYQKLMDEYEFTGDVHFCKYYIEEIKKLPYEILEKLIDLYEKFYNDNAQEKKCDCGCAKECASLYDEHRKFCLENKDINFCNELENFKKKYDNNMLSLSECIEAPKSLPSVKEYDVSLIIITPISLIVFISFTLFILYKFIPLASLKYSKIKRRKNIYNHIEHQSKQLLHERMCNIDSYNIKYQTNYRS
ncbi:PIR protein [Plasmodium vivax]|nr:PIR protein [Plasmodium vivax]